MEINQSNKPNQCILYYYSHVKVYRNIADFVDYADFTPFKAYKVKISAFTTNLMGEVA